MRCCRCRRLLKRQPYLYFGGSPIGPGCLQAVAGTKPRRVRRASEPDEKQAVLPLEVLNADQA